MEYLDFFNRPISIGDIVICKYVSAGTAHITIGTVVNFTPKKVKVTTKVNHGDSYFDKVSANIKYRNEYKDAKQCIIANDLMSTVRDIHPEYFL